ncbi:MAG TPA: DNA polymerase III subunit delta [Alkalispirochaeta sp.]|nr:DNA polymerase III subunit delta [Alkalispirochaeta sp.]
MSSAPIVLFLGPEEGEKRAAIEEIRAALKKEHGDGLEEHSFYAFETPADQVVALLQNGSLFGSGTLVRYRSVEHLKRKDEIEPLRAYSTSPNPAAVLVLESPEVSVSKALDTVAGGRQKRIFWEMFDDQKQGWLQGYFRRREVSIDPDAVELMLELVQNNTIELRQEADRLIAFVGQKISVDDVDQYIYHAREESIFSLFDAVMAEDLDHALDIVGKLLAGSEAIQVVIGLSWQFDRLYHLQALREAGVVEKNLFQELGRVTGQRVSSKRVQKNLMAATRRYSPSECAAIKELIGEVDALLRTVPSPLHESILEQCMYATIVRRGAWSPTGARRPTAPWQFPLSC